jgi:hypothetical protein
MASRTCNF